MRTTITLDPDVYEAAMYLSRSSGRRLGKVLSELARTGLIGPQIRKPRRKGRFPVFDVSPDALVIPGSRIQKIIDDEGII